MKKISILCFFILLKCFVFGQTKNADNYIVFYDKPNTAHYFKMGKSSYLIYYNEDKVKFGDKEYYAKVRRYSWGDVDTSYYREDEKNYYHFDPKINSESVVLPKVISLGQKWYEADSSWSYEVIGIDERLETPYKKYKGLIVIECIQLTNRDKDKSKEYHLYYARGLGLVGSVKFGMLTSYLADVKKNVKDGAGIGK